MEHEYDLIYLAIVSMIAACSGFVMTRFKQPALVGFIYAGILLGPSGLSLVKNATEISFLAELGVILLLFVVGLEISLRALRPVIKIVLFCALVQLVVGVSGTLLFGFVFEWPIERALLVGFVLSLSSTAVGIKLVDQIGEGRTNVGRITVGVLVAQDLLIIPMLLTVNSLGPNKSFDISLLRDIGLAMLLVGGLIYFLSRREKIRLPFTELAEQNHDAGPLAVVAFCLAFASASHWMGLSPAFGAFLAGLVLGASTVRKYVLKVSLPLESIMMMIFFLSIGLAVDVRFIISKAGTIFGLLILLIPLKTVVNLWALRRLKVLPKEAIIASVAMAQLGEFGFVLTAAGLSSGAIASDGYQIALSVIALSLAASPIWMSVSRKIVMHPKAEGQTTRELLSNVYSRELAFIKRTFNRKQQPK